MDMHSSLPPIPPIRERGCKGPSRIATSRLGLLLLPTSMTRNSHSHAKRSCLVRCNDGRGRTQNKGGAQTAASGSGHRRCRGKPISASWQQIFLRVPEPWNNAYRPRMSLVVDAGLQGWCPTPVSQRLKAPDEPLQALGAFSCRPPHLDIIRNCHAGVANCVPASHVATN